MRMNILRTVYGWMRIPLGVAAILLAYFAQTRIVNGVVPQESIAGYAVAAGLFVAAFITTEAARFAGARLFAPLDAAGVPARPSRISVVLFALGIALSAAGVWRFSAADNRSGWLLFVASVFVYAISFMEFSWKRLSQDEKRRETEAGGWGRAGLRWLWRGVPFLALIGLALALRLPDLGTFPYGFWYDEAAAGLAATRILNGLTPWPIWSPILAVSPHYHFVTAISISLFGPEITTIRMQAVLMGTSAVILSYLLFRRWFGMRLGLIAAGFWAALRYMIIWSRLGQDWISVLPFETAILLLFDLGLETKKLRYFAWAGLTMGVSIAFYYPNRLFVAVVLGYGLLLLAAWVIRRTAQRRMDGEAAAHAMPLRQAFGRGAAVVGVVSLSAVISGMPVGYYALTNWEDFNARQATVSIFTKRDEPDLGKAIQSQIQKHVLMYNVRGDPNPRHNFPGDPMLDPIIGSLAILGLAYALSRFYRPANALMLLTFVIMIAGAILSIDFEAPQSLRAIGTQPAVIYFAALPLVLLARATGEQLNPLWQRARLRRFVYPPLNVLATLTLLAVVGLVTQYSYTAYYIKQRNSAAVYTDHSTPETVMAYEMNRLIRDYDLIVTQTYFGVPTVAFLAPAAMARAKMWSGNDPLDLTTDGTRGIAILVDPKLAAAFDQLRRSFPNATFRQFVSPMGGSSELLFEALLSPGDLRDAQGLEARVYPGDAFMGAPTLRVGLSAAKADWSGGTAPATAPFAAELRGALNVTRDGAYRFAVRGSSNPQLFIDEFPVAAEPVMLARGKHSVRLRLPVAAAAFELQWQPPGGSMGPIPASVLLKPPATATGLLASYYRNTDWQGAPAFTQVEPEINFYYHILPLPRPYSIEWKGKLFAPVAGVYTLSTDSRDESVVIIDDSVAVTNPDSKIASATVTLSRGWHDIRIRFVDKTGYTHIYLYWTPPGGTRQIIPTRYLSPPMGVYPEADVLAALPDPAPIASVVSQPPGRAETAYAGPVAIVAPSFQLPALTLPSITMPQITLPNGAAAATPQPGKPAPANQPGVAPPAQPAAVPALNLTAVRACLLYTSPSPRD